MRVMPLNIAIAAGGTAGHVNPALAVAEELRRRGHRVRFFGQKRRLEGTLVPEAGFDLVSVEVQGFDRERPFSLITAVGKIMAATSDIKALFVREGLPDVAVGFGAYVELPLLRACRTLRIPFVIHEQNSVPGLANKLMAKHASRLCLAIPHAKAAFSGVSEDRMIVTGNPVRSGITNASREAGRRQLGLTKDETLLLVFGGSLGARHINETMARLKEQILSRPELRVVHSTGAGDYEDSVKLFSLSDEEIKRYRLMPYISNMGEMLAASDLVLSRSGASTVAEISALSRPSILVPYPFATEDHQRTNAALLTEAGAAILVDDSELDSENFEEQLLGLLDDPERREAMAEAARGLMSGSAAERLADVIEQVGVG